MKITYLTSAILLTTALTVHAQKTSLDFNLYLQSHPVGRAKVSLQQSAKGVKLNTRFAYKYLAPGVEGMKPAVTSVDVADEFLYSTTFVYLDGTSENMDNHFRNSFVPSKQRDEIVIQDQNGYGSANSEPFKIGKNLLLLINFDPGAAQCALRSIIATPTPEPIYSVLLGTKPHGRKGGDRASGGRRGSASTSEPEESRSSEDTPITIDAKFSSLPDTTGTLDGKVIPVHAYQLVSSRISWFFFADNDENLLETDVLPIHADYIRAGFQRSEQTATTK